MAITFRDEKNAPLTHQEVDANFRSFFFTASFSENNLSLQRKDGVTVNVPIGGEAFADFQANGGSIGNVYIANSQVTGSRMILDLLQGQFYDKTKGPGSIDGSLSSDEWYIDFDPAASAPYFVHFGSNFAISSSGFLHASGAVISGNITATSGNIGGFGLTSDAIHGPTTLGVPSFYISGSAGADGYFISASKFNVKGNGDITGSAVLFSGGTIAGWGITNSTIAKSTHIVLDATNESISINDSTFGNKGIQLEYNNGAPRFYVGDATGSFVKFDGTNVSLSTALLEISASNIEISSTEASMSLGAGIKLLGSTSTIEVGQANKVKLVATATDAFLVAGAKTAFGTNDAGIIMGMDSTIPTFDLTKDASNYVRFDSTSGIDIKTDTFKLDTTNFDIDSSTQRLNIFNSASAEIIRLGEISDAASDLYGIKIFNGLGTGSANTIAMFGQQGNKIGGWEVTDSQIRTVPSAGFGEQYSSTENGLIIHSSGRLESSNFVSNVKGWRIDTLGNGSAEFENMRIRGTLRTTVFEKESVNVVGGQLMIANSTTIEPLRSETGTIIAGSSSYAANAVTFSVANVSGFKEGEILKIKSVSNTGFSLEYLYVSGSKRYSSDSSIVYETGSLDPDGLAGELYVERGYGGAAPSVSASLTTITTNISTTSETTIEVASNSGFLLQSIIKIGTERLKVTNIAGTVLTVIRGYHDSTADSHVSGNTVFLIDTDKEFLSGLVSSPVAYNEGQVIVSTGVYNPEEDISSGYIMMNANPRDISTPYMDIVERTGSGVYDLQLRSRLGDLSGLSSGYLYGNNEPGFGLYTENGFFKGSITAETGSIAGILHVATVAGGLETGQKISIGRDVSGTNDGIYVNNNNYWYTDGAWKVGGSSNFISLDNFTDGNLVVKTQTFTLDTPTFMISSSLNSGTITAGTSASAITNTTGTGIYMDGTGKFRVGTPTTGNNYIYWDGSTLNIKGAIDITGGTGATQAELDAATGSLSSSLAGEISASDAAYSASALATTDNLDGKIFTDSSGRAVRPPTASSEGLYLASTNLGFYKDGEWKTYMDNQGDFFLTGSAGNKLSWDSATGNLEIKGSITITGGNAATQDFVTGSVDTVSGSIATGVSASNAALSASISASSATLQDGLDSANNVISGKAAIFRQNDAPSASGRTVGDMWIDSNDGNKVYVWNGAAWAATPDGTYDQTVLINSTSASLSSSVALDIFTSDTGMLVGTPSTSSAGLYLGDTALGFYSASEWRTYMANNGNFYLTGSDGNFLAWDGGQLSIQGSINITGGNAATSDTVAAAQAAAEAFASGSAENAVLSGSAAATAAQNAAQAHTDAATGSLSGSIATAISASSATTTELSASQAQTNTAFSLVQSGLNSIFKQASAPATESRHQGDLWLDSDDGNKVYVYIGTEWVVSADTTYDQSTLINDNSASVALDTFTDSTGKIQRTPNPDSAGLYLGDTNLGFYSGSSWQTYMANNGNFFLTGSETNYLKWDGTGLTIAGTINIVGGNAATNDSVTDAAAAAVLSGSAAAAAVSSSLSGSIINAQSTATAASGTATTAAQTANAATASANTALSRTVDATGKVVFNPTPTGQGLFMNATNLGFYSASQWGAYLSASGEFYLTGSGNSGMSWDGSELTVDGEIVARSGEIGGITLESNKLYNGEGTHSDASTGFYLDSSSNFSLGDKLTWDGTNLAIEGSITVTNSTDFASQAELDLATGSAADQFAAAVASGSAAAANAAASASAVQGNLNTATGSLSALATGSAANAVLSGSAAATAAVTSITGSITSAQSTANAATSSAANAAASASAVQTNLNTATGSLSALATGSAANAVLSGSAAAATVQTNLNTATGSLSALATGSAANAVLSGSAAATAAAASASAVQGNLDNANVVISGLSGVTASLQNPTSYDFGPSATMTLATLGSTPSGTGLYAGADKLGYFSASAWLTYMGNDGTFLLSGSGDDSLLWNGTSLRIGSPGVGPSLTYTFSGSLNEEVFDKASNLVVRTVTDTIQGNAFNNLYGTDQWNVGFHSKAVFDRNDGGVFEWDVVVSDLYTATMIGLFKESPSSYHYNQQHHTVYLQENQIRIYENGDYKNGTATTAWTTGVDTLLRISIQVLPAGARYKVFKNGDFETPLFTYDSGASGITNQYFRPGASIHYGVDTPGRYVMFNRMSAGASLGISTKISGNVVQTGAIASSNWSATLGSNFDLDGGTFKLGGSSAPKLSWNGSSLSIIGDIQVTNPDTFATPSTKNKSDYKIILVATGSAGSTASAYNVGHISSSLGYTGGNVTTWYYDNNNASQGETNPANIAYFDELDYDLYVFDNQNWATDGSEIQLALNLFDLGKAVLIAGNDTTNANYTGSYNTQWPIKNTLAASGTGWMYGDSAAGKGIPSSHPILAGVTGTVGISTFSDSGRLIQVLKKAPGGGTIIHPFSLKGSTSNIGIDSNGDFSAGSGGITSFIGTNPRGGRLVNLQMYGLSMMSAPATKNLVNFLLRTDPAIEAHYMQVTSITGEMVTTGKIESTNFNYVSGNFSSAGTQFNLDSGNLRSSEFSIINGDAYFAGDISGANGTFSGALSATTGTIGGFNIHADKIFSGADENVSTYTTQTGRTIISSSGAIHTNQFYVDKSGNAGFKGSLSGADISGATGAFAGTITVGGEDLGSVIAQNAAGMNSLMSNPDFYIANALDGRPAGVYASYGNATLTNVSYSGSAQDGILRIHNSTDSSIGASFQAFPVDVTNTYKIYVRLRTDKSGGASSGLYLRMYESTGGLTSGKTSIGMHSAESGVQSQNRIGTLANRTINGTATTSFDNKYINTVYTDYQFTYTPAAGTTHAALSILNWEGNGTNSVYVSRASIVATGEDLYTGVVGGWTMDSTAIYVGAKDTNGYTAGGITLSAGGSIHAKQFYIDTSGNANFKGSITGASGDFAGNLNGSTITGGTIAIGSSNNIFRATTSGISLGHTTQTSAPFRVSQAGVLAATSGQVGSWVISSGTFRDSSSRIILDPANKKIEIKDSSAATKIEISAGSIPAISATRSINLGFSATQKVHMSKRDSTTTGTNGSSDTGYSANQINPLPQAYTFGTSVSRGTVTTTSFTHLGGDLPVIIPVGDSPSMGTFEVRVPSWSSGSYYPQYYNKFIQASLTYSHTLFYNLEEEVSGGCGSGTSWQNVGYDYVTLGTNNENSASFSSIRVRKADLQQASWSTTVYEGTANIATHPTYGEGFGATTINKTYANKPAGTYRVSITQNTSYTVKNHNTQTISTGTSTGSPAIYWTMNFNEHSAAGTPITVGTFTSQVKIGLNGVQISGADGSVVLGDAADDGVANIYGNVLVTGRLTANTSNLSDRRLKDNILNIGNALELIGNLTPKSFKWKNNVNPDETRGESYGFIAQEMTGSFSHLVNVQPKLGYIEDVLTVDQMPIVALNTAGIQALIEKITTLENKVIELETAVSGSE